MKIPRRFALPIALIAIACTFDAPAKPRPPLPPYPERALKSWRFDDDLWRTNAATAPLAAINLSFVESWSGHALRMAGSEPAILALAEQGRDGRLNAPMNGPATIRWWFSPEWTSASAGGTGPKAAARLLEVGAWSGREAVGWRALSIDPTGDAVSFAAESGGARAAVLEAPIQWKGGQWHQVALSWDPQGKTVLFVDGQVAAQGPGVGLKPLTDFAGIRGLSLGSDVHGGSLARGQFEEVYTFDRILTEAELAQDYERSAALAALGPVTPEEEAAQAALLAEAKAAYGEGGAGPLAMSAEDYGCDLWLRIVPSTSPGAVIITIHNTLPGKTYQLLSKPDLNSATWSVEQTFTGAAGQDYTQRTVPMLGRPMLFFLAVELGEFMVEASFEGLDIGDTDAVVPDSMGAVGPNHFVELLNNAIVVYEKTGSVPQGGGPLPSGLFFRLQETQGDPVYPTGGFVQDPRILYDHQENRWIACGLDAFGSDEVLLAVSEGPSPVPLDDSNWTKHRVRVARLPDFADFPTLGLDANGVYVSVVYLSSRSNLVVAIDKDLLYQGTYQAWPFPLESVAPSLRVVQPAVNFDTPVAGDYAWFVAKGLRTEAPYQGGPIIYRRLQWSGGVPGWADTAWPGVAETSYRNYFDLDAEDLFADSSISAPQAGGPTDIRLTPDPVTRDRVGSRLSMAVIRQGVLWTCHHVGLDDEDGDYGGDKTGEGVDRSAIQWLKLPISTENLLTYGAHGRIFDDCSMTPHWYYDGSLMVNNAGDIVIGFSGSSELSFISAYYSWRRADGTTSDRPGLIKKGEDYFNFDRWGDYSYTSLDPVDGLTIWTVQEYARPQGVFPDDFRWGTWIGKVTD
jgi:hypothetical protein